MAGTATTTRVWPRFIPFVAWMGVIFAFSAQETLPKPPGIGMEITSVAGHFTVYAVLAGLTWWVLGGFALTSRKRVLIAFGVAILYGITDEWHQSFVPGRTPDIWDLVVDAIGATIGIAFAIGLAHLIDRRRQASTITLPT